MATIPDYLEWRGDVPFPVAPLNEADLYVIGKFGMLDYTGIVPETGEYIPASLAVERALADGRGETLGAVTSPRVVPAVRAAAAAPRYADLLLTGWRQHISPDEDEQFAAVTVRGPGGMHFITFRGTDDTLVGWKEDLLMTVLDAVPAQADALRYLQWALDTYPGPVTVLGHSKGGNLAVFASALVSPEQQNRISAVYDFDGPGFREEFLASEGYRRIKSRVTVIVPHNSTVGTLMYREGDDRVVRSTVSAFSAHDGFTWEVTPAGSFVPEKELSTGSRAFDKAMKDVLEGMTPDERRAFIEELFGTLASTGAVTVKDLTEQKLRELLRTARSLNQEPGVHRWVTDTMDALLQSYLAETRPRLPRLLRETLLRRRSDKPAAPAAAPAPPAENDWY